MADNAAGGGDGGTGGGDQAPATEPPQWFTKWADANQARIDGRFSGLVEKYDSKLAALNGGRGDTKKDGEGEPKTPAPTAPQGLSESDVQAIVAFGEVRGKVPETAREGLDKIQKEQGYAAAVQAAQLISTLAESTKGDADGGNQSPVTKGHGASPAKSTPNFPKTMAELNTLMMKKPDEARAVIAHPDFDIDAFR